MGETIPPSSNIKTIPIYLFFIQESFRKITDSFKVANSREGSQTK